MIAGIGYMIYIDWRLASTLVCLPVMGCHLEAGEAYAPSQRRSSSPSTKPRFANSARRARGPLVRHGRVWAARFHELSQGTCTPTCAIRLQVARRRGAGWRLLHRLHHLVWRREIARGNLKSSQLVPYLFVALRITTSIQQIAASRFTSTAFAAPP